MKKLTFRARSFNEAVSNKPTCIIESDETQQTNNAVNVVFNKVYGLFNTPTNTFIVAKVNGNPCFFVWLTYSTVKI